MLKAGYATQAFKFDNIMEFIKQTEIETIRSNMKVKGKNGKSKPYMPYTYPMSELMDMWTKSHDGKRHYGVMTTNILENFNGVLKGAQGLLIVAVVEFTWAEEMRVGWEEESQE